MYAHLCFLLSVMVTLSATQAATNVSFDKRFEAYNRQQGPGFAAMVIKDGQVVYKKGFGFASLRAGKRTRITASTNFNLASNSKQFTAMGILLLEQDKKLSPEDYISKFIPEVPDYMKSIKIKHLIHHTSGLPDYMEVCGRKPVVLNADILATLFKKDKLLFPAGSRYEYSNSGYVILSEIIQRIAAKPFPDFIRDEIFQKLSMKSSFVFSKENEPKVTNRALGYNEWPYLSENDANPCNYNFGDGGVYTNLDDYQKWVSFLEHPTLLLKPEFQKKMFEPAKTNSGEVVAYGYGWRTGGDSGEKMILHKGAWTGFRSFAGFVPEKRLWLVFFSNYAGISLDENPAAFFAEFTK